MTLDEMILDWELNDEATESNELVRMEKLIRALIAERKVRAGRAGDVRTELATRFAVAITSNPARAFASADMVGDESVKRADALIAALAKETK